VRFDRLPEKGLKLWAQLANASDGGTIGETLQVDVKVVAPKFSISFEPAAAKIGQEVTARIAVSPAPVDPALLSFQWAEPASSARRELDHAATAIAFTPRDTKPVALLARAIVPVAADRVGEVSAKFTATGFKLAAKVVEPGTRPMIWKVGVGLVPVAKGSYAGDEQLTVEAKFEDEQPTGEIRWNWTANEGTSVSNPVSQSPQLSRHETGTASATVTAKDKNEFQRQCHRRRGEAGAAAKRHAQDRQAESEDGRHGRDHRRGARRQVAVYLCVARSQPRRRESECHFETHGTG
jgi:hypothetical protein